MIPQEIIPESHDNANDAANPISSDYIPNRYELPPRSTREVPPKRCDPKFKAPMSRYLVSRENNKALSQIVVVFNTSLYFNIVHKDVEKALKDLNWKKVMIKEMSILYKNETWKK